MTRRLVLTGFVLAAFAVACFTGLIPVEGYYHWWQARRALERHDLAAALGHLERVQQEWPRDGHTQFLMAQASRRSGDYEHANEHFERARRLGHDPQELQFEELLGTAQGGVLHVSERPLLALLEDAHPQKFLILEALIRGYLQQRNYGAALPLIADWKQSYPDMWQPGYFRGLALQKSRAYEAAAEEWEKVLERHPEMTPVRYELAELLLGRGHLERSYAHFRACVQRAPGHVKARVGLGRCLHSLGQLDEARPHLDEALAQEPRNGAALLARGRIELELSGPAEALPWLEKARTIEPRKLETLAALAAAYRRLDRPEAGELEARYQELQKHESELARVHEKYLQRARDPKHQDQARQLRFEIGTLYHRLGQDDEARYWLLGILAEDPQHGGARKLLEAITKGAAQ